MTELSSLVADALELSPHEVVDALSMATCTAWDSLGHLSLIVSIESAFDVDLTGDEIAGMTSVGAIKDVLSTRGVALVSPIA